MAQDLNAVGKKKRMGMLQLGSKQISGRLDPLTDPLAPYYIDNFEIIDKNTDVRLIMDVLIDRLVSKGFVFILEDETICKPSSSFMSVIDNYWYNFTVRSIRFIACKGYLVWFKNRTDNGIEIPDVPDWTSIVVDHQIDEKTGASNISAKWANEKTRTQLYVIHRGLPFGISMGFQSSIVDTIKQHLMFIQHMDRCRILTFNRLAQPDILLYKPEKAGGSKIQGDNLAPSSHMEELMMSYGDEIDDDDTAQGRIENIKAKYADIDLAEENSNPILPHLRMQSDMLKPMPLRFVGAPQGMQPSVTDTRVPDLEYNITRKTFISDIAAAFGIVDYGGAKPPQSNNNNNSNNNNGASSGGYDNNPTGDRLYMWKESIKRVLTSAFRVLYAKSSIRVGDIKPTYSEQHHKVLGARETWDISITRPDPRSDPRSDPNSEPPQKKLKPSPPSENISEEEEKKEPTILHHRTVSAKEDNSMPTGGPAAQNQTESGGMTHDEEQGTEMIHMMLMSHLLGHRDTAKLLRDQGGISEEAFFEMHPPVEVDSKKEKEMEARRQEWEKEEKKLEEEKKKFKEEQTAAAHKHEMEEMRIEMRQVQQELKQVKSKK